MELRGERPDLFEELLSGPQEALALLRVLIDTAADAYYVWNPFLDRYEYSRQFAAILCMPFDQLPADDAGVTALYHPDDRDRVFESWNAVWPQGDHWQAEYRLRRGDGTWAVLDERAVILHDDAGTAIRLIGMVRDVTLERQTLDALLASRNLYEALFREAREPALRVDPAGVVLDANAPGLEWFGLAASDLGAVDVASLLSPGDAAQLRLALSGALPADRPNLEIADLEGRRHLLVSLAPCHTGEGVTVFLVGADITESQRLREQLEASEAELRAQSASLADTNTALRVILEQRDRDRRDLEARLVANIQELVLPVLDDVQRSLSPQPQAIRLAGLRQTLENVTSDVLPEGASGYFRYPAFTRRESEIAALIRAGKTSKEIADALFLAPATVTAHRRSMRRKLGLAGPGSRLSWALSTPADREDPPEGACPAGGRR